MDEILQQFESALNPYSADSKTNFVGLYKNWGKLGNQEQRRRDLLESQKLDRQSKLDTCRGILELIEISEETDIFKEKRQVFYRPQIYVAGFNKTSLAYNNVLMMSEWMIEKPVDFDENWLVVPCPKGVRMLVVAVQGKTKCYTKHGHFRFQKVTALPGGHRGSRRNACCVLDCFYDEKSNTMFVLDLLAWNNQPMTDGETEFRHYWLETQFQDYEDELQKITRRNQLIFKILPKTPCCRESFQTFMNTFPAFEQNRPVLDGLLFYHKRAHYFSGVTPLVGWLFPYMVPEVIKTGIEIHSCYELQRPSGYIDQAHFIEEFEAKNKIKKKAVKQRSNSMDTAEAVVEKAGDADIAEETETKQEEIKAKSNPDSLCATVPESMDEETETKKEEIKAKSNPDSLCATVPESMDEETETKKEEIKAKSNPDSLCATVPESMDEETIQESTDDKADLEKSDKSKNL